MRELFEQLNGPPLDPVTAARRAMRPTLHRRFYARAEVGQDFAVRLDGRPVRTPARKVLAAPTYELASAIAAEWASQTEFIDPATMPLTRLANSIIDGVSGAQQAVAAEIERYMGCDLLLYRAGEPAELVERQARLWDPVLTWARAQLGADLVLARGVVHVVQPAPAMAALRAAIPDDPWRLGALHSATTLTGSALLALALAAGEISVERAWAAAHVDEDWNMDLWGQDREALARRAFRFAEMQAAATVLRLA